MASHFGPTSWGHRPAAAETSSGQAEDEQLAVEHGPFCRGFTEFTATKMVISHSYMKLPEGMSMCTCTRHFFWDIYVAPQQRVAVPFGQTIQVDDSWVQVKAVASILWRLGIGWRENLQEWQHAFSCRFSPLRNPCIPPVEVIPPLTHWWDFSFTLLCLGKEEAEAKALELQKRLREKRVPWPQGPQGAGDFPAFDQVEQRA